MGPKKGSKKEKVVKAPPPRQTKSQYLARIAEMNAVLAQVRKEAFDVEGIYVETDKRYDQVQEDLADVLEYLKHEIKVCEDEIAVFDLGIKKYENEIDVYKKFYTNIFAEKEELFETTKRDFTEKIDAVNAKLNSLDEVKRHREEYVKRMEVLEKAKEEMVIRHRHEMYEAEKQAIIEQDKLQKEMESRVTRLAVDFREATDIRIGETSNRIINENIKLGNLLTCQQELLAKVRTDYTNTTKIQHFASLGLELKEGEYNLIHIKYSRQTSRIEKLIKMLENQAHKISELRKLVKTNRMLKRKISELECYIKTLEEERAMMLKTVDEKNTATAGVKGNLKHFQNNIIKLQVSLFEAAKKVKEAIQCENIFAELEGTGSELQEEDDLIKKGESIVLQETQMENMYVLREALIEEIILKLQSGMLSADELRLLGSSTELIGFSRSVDRSHLIKRSEQQMSSFF